MAFRTLIPITDDFGNVIAYYDKDTKKVVTQVGATDEIENTPKNVSDLDYYLKLGKCS